MKFPLYIYYELLIRLSEFVPDIGIYLSVKEGEEKCLVRTTNGQIEIAVELIYKQFQDPNLISREDIAELGRFFVLGGRLYN